jgi:ankyrin repeat protein
MDLNNKNKNKIAKRAKLMLDATNEYCIKMYNRMMDENDGCSTPEELMVLLNDCPIESLKMHHVDNKYLLFNACQHIGYENFALRLWKLYPEAAILQDGWKKHRNPLQIACSVGCIDTATKLLNDDECKFLNMPDSNGRTALFYASRINNVAVVTMLLSHQNINVNVQDKYGQTALHFSCVHLSYDVIGLLLNIQNINLNLEENVGILLHGTAFRTFFRTISMTRHNTFDNMHHIFNMFLRLIPIEEISCEVDGSRVNFIHDHAEGGWTYFYGIDFFMQNGFEFLMHQQDSLGESPLHTACRHRRENIETYMTTFMKFPNLLPNLKNIDGATPLHIACYCCNHKMAQFLVVGNYNVDINLSDNNGDSVLHSIIDGKDNATDELSVSNMMHLILWKNPFIVLHRNNQNENALDYAMKVQENDAFTNDDYSEEFWSNLISLLYSHTHLSRIHMYKYLMNDKSVDLEIVNYDDSILYSVVERATLNDLL